MLKRLLIVLLITLFVFGLGPFAAIKIVGMFGIKFYFGSDIFTLGNYVVGLIPMFVILYSINVLVWGIVGLLTIFGFSKVD